MKGRYSIIFGVFLGMVTSCAVEDEPGLDIIAHSFNFNDSDHGWTPGFSDYPVSPDDSAYFELKYAYTEQPQVGKSIMLSGHNYSAELFLFLKKRITDLKPNADYTITFTINLACNTPSGYVDDPYSAFLKVGATGIEPKSVIDKGNYVMNIDKGDERISGDDMIFIGEVTPPVASSDLSYNAHTNASSREVPPSVRTNSKGELWLIVGTELATSGVTTLYYTKINVALSTAH
jgi:hypothetical protein